MQTERSTLPTALSGLIAAVRERLPAGARRADLFERCFANTWNTTIQREDDGTTFVITGDIPAMWLRDSTAQVRAYIIPAAEDEEVAEMIRGLVERQFRLILADPYANAFNQAANGRGHQEDLTESSPLVWERKYEIDSLCYPIQLAYLLWKNTGMIAQFNDTMRQGVQTILELWRTEQHHETQSPYRFQRLNCPPTDTLVREGKGSETVFTGMTWSGFRPSDDACTYGYLVPSNMFAVVVLGYVSEIATGIWQDPVLAAEAAELAAEIESGIHEHAIIQHPEHGLIYAYETDGLGHHHLMDDANVPSLLSIPYLGYAAADDALYQRTRAFLLSKDNPYYYEGEAASGIGSPHTPNRYIWPIALAMQGLTASDPAEREAILELLERTDAGTGMMHEGFHADDPSQYTREWFSWANMMYCELVLLQLGYKIRNI
ncbi:glycoside hydrolase family 125 protein [Paenibacillus daejeonensis]|uniref:glycoside hydrolase family 125 protein n=1 Tax=Paenibacillus daejeonensis TaxID=135193 RepID=UPI000361CA6C|nr:glycoside hydrolase family 125 protein [Paenibacillus daejeonensis]